MKTSQENVVGGQMARRSFLKFASAGAMAAGVVATAASCKKREYVDDDHVDLGSGDIAILNYAYALEQLEAAFYTQVAANFYANISSEERALLTDIRDHEISHRELFKAALSSSAIPALTPNFSSIDFNNRNSVLSAAKAFEDLGVAAYNGAGAMIKSADYLTLAGKIVSVEARHAATVRNLLQFNSFVDNTIVDIANTSLEKSKTPQEVVPIANTFLTGKKIAAPSLGIY
ncbi:ferritin-like domain-containing protein [Mucilaginibacter sp. Bleaf8]|uniref:ferritin-like domain-containing protein n=1 Tax=Mucilaginibacter sp. Bleaf8 TaxID=2834430 RepID=UPI001BCBFE62|nr:ferritin-like domain-containing protein [Mucilaginibacter sp. Bleaf8]MBS7563434.1 ferritin-like domain-containing protein [Mucilaginibacter sp. Bleaf8]